MAEAPASRVRRRWTSPSGVAQYHDSLFAHPSLMVPRMTPPEVAAEVDARIARVTARTRGSRYPMAWRFRLEEAPAAVEVVGWRETGGQTIERARRFKLTDLVFEEERVMLEISALEHELRDPSVAEA